MQPLTPEERKEQAARAYMQKKESIATGVLFNLMHNDGVTRTLTSKEIASCALEIADEFMQQLYFTPKEDKE